MQKNISLHCTTSILVPVLLLLQLLVLQYSTITSVLPTTIVEVGPTRFNVGNLLNTGSTAWHMCKLVQLVLVLLDLVRVRLYSIAQY